MRIFISKTRLIHSHYYSIYKLIISLLIIAVVDLLMVFSHLSGTFGDNIFIFLKGYGLGYVSIQDFLFIVIINGIPIYLSSLIFDEKVVQKSEIILIRYKRKLCFLKTILASNIIYLILYFIFNLIIIISICALLGKDINLYSYKLSLIQDVYISKKLNMPLIILGGLTLRIIEIFCMQLIIYCIQTLNNKTIVGFLVILAGYIIMFVNNINIYPFGISSLIRWVFISNNAAISYLIALLELLSIILASYYYLKYKGINKLLEG